jgi:hypothetical protein
MRILYLIIFYCILSSACSSSKRVNQVSNKTQNSDFITEENDKEDPILIQKAEYNKHFKIVTPQGYQRYVERIYYGPQTEILKDFAKIDIHQELVKEKYNKFPIASFFSPSAISIPEDKKEKARLLYKPLIDTLLLNPDTELNYHFEILILGYTDESSIDEDSILFSELITKSPHLAYSKYALSNAVSYYRAKDIGTMISAVLNERKDEFKMYNKLIIDIIQEGRGLEFPDLKREYEFIDSKRRIAKVYWRKIQ